MPRFFGTKLSLRDFSDRRSKFSPCFLDDRNVGLLLCVYFGKRARHDSFIFPHVNKSAGVCGSSENRHECQDCSTSRVPVRQAMTSNSGASCLPSCCAASALSQNTTHTIHIRFRVSTAYPYLFFWLVFIILFIILLLNHYYNSIEIINIKRYILYLFYSLYI